jgi:hypothetical protein
VILCTSNLGLSQPDPTVLTVQAAGLPLAVENVGTVLGGHGPECFLHHREITGWIAFGRAPCTYHLARLSERQLSYNQHFGLKEVNRDPWHV